MRSRKLLTLYRRLSQNLVDGSSMGHGQGTLRVLRPGQEALRPQLLLLERIEGSKHCSVTQETEVFSMPPRNWNSGTWGVPTVKDCYSVSRGHSVGGINSRFYSSATGTGGAVPVDSRISVTFVDKDGEETKIAVPVGMSMLEAAHENDIELEGACEGSLACSTCHVIVMDEDMYSKLPEPSDEENDMLDLAFGLTETSRLGCQVIAEKELDGLRLALPAATRNFAVDGHVPKPH